MNEPTTLDEAVDYLIAHMSEADQKAYANGAPVPHFTLGMSMRNEWGLWFTEKPLAKWLHDRGIKHGDDKSGVIFDALRARLKGESFDLVAAADWYRRFWEWSESGGRMSRLPFYRRKDGSIIYPFEDDYPKTVSHDDVST